MKRNEWIIHSVSTKPGLLYFVNKNCDKDYSWNQKEEEDGVRKGEKQIVGLMKKRDGFLG